MKILILGGTGEARLLAERLVALDHAVVTSLAGRTATPLLPAGDLRIGGFGGEAGLAHYLAAEGIDQLVDATHPYAARISGNAVAAARMARVPLVRLTRPGWTRPEGADWAMATDFAEAARKLPSGARVLVTTGQSGLDALATRVDCHFLLRMIGAPLGSLKENMTLLRARPPFTLAYESKLMRGEAITHLLTRNSGGSQTAAKLEAASSLGVAVVMLARPVLAAAREARSVEEVVAVLRANGFAS